MRSVVLSVVLALMPLPVDISGILPSEVNAVISLLPRRHGEERKDRYFLETIGAEQIATWLVKDIASEDIRELLQLLPVVAPHLGETALAQVDLDALAERVREADSTLSGRLLATIRGIDTDAAIGVADRLGVDWLLDRALTTIPDCRAVRISDDGKTVHSLFLVDASDPANVSSMAARITAALYDLFPAATESEVTGFLGVGMTYPDATKRILRGNTLPPHIHVMLNQYWLSVCNQRLAAQSLASALGQHDEVGRLLLAAVRDVWDSMGAMGGRTMAPALRRWNEAVARVNDILYVPYRTAPLHETLEQEGLKDALPGSQPIDRSLNEIQNAAYVAHRELVNKDSDREMNRALLVNSLARIQRESRSYRDIRVSLNIGDPADIDWTEDLSIEACRLREALEVLTLPDIDRRFRAESHHFVERFKDLRAVANDLLEHAQSAVSTGTNWPNGVAQATALRQAAAESLADFTAYGRYEALVLAADTLIAFFERLANTHMIESINLEPAEDMVNNLSDLDPVDVEVWLARRSWWYQTSKNEAEAAAALQAQGIEAAYRVFPSSPENPMWRTAAVVVRVSNLQEVDGIKDVVADSAFSLLPDDVQHLSLLISHQDAMVMPIGYEIWRTSNLGGTLFSMLSRDSRWLPKFDIELFTEQLNVTIDHRTHPVAHRITALCEDVMKLELAAAQLEVVVRTALEQIWAMQAETIVSQLRKVASIVASMGERLEELDYQADEYSSWRTTIRFSLAIVGEFLQWFVNVMKGEAHTMDLVTLQQSFSDIDICVHNLLYLNVDSAESRLCSLDTVDVNEWYQAARAVLADLEQKLLVSGS